ncbi:MAG: ComF family protein [Clostridia bacterium]|nr:ComF family protein [Clostridia bacterium]
MTLNDLSGRLLHMFLPDRCAFCGDVVTYNTEICDKCRPQLNRQEAPICVGCGRSKPHCQCKADGRRHWNGAIAPFVYENEGVTGESVRRLKHSHNKKNAETLGKEIAACVQERFGDVPFDCVMPVPMTKKDERKRGYSQSLWIAQAVATEMSIPCENVLQKILQTKPQKKLSAKKRRVNLRGAIDLDEMFDLPEKTVLVVDDAITTGSTLDECARVLKIYGAAAVYVAAVCIVYKKGKDSDGGSETGN